MLVRVTQKRRISNHADILALAGPVLANILYHVGNDQQKHWAAMAIERNWGATMVLTEPDAGSDVGAGRTKAVPQPDGTCLPSSGSASAPSCPLGQLDLGANATAGTWTGLSCCPSGFSPQADAGLRCGAC